MKQIVYWMGVPLSEVPRDELEQALIDAHENIVRLQQEVATRSIAHIRDLSAMARERSRSPWMKFLIGRS